MRRMPGLMRLERELAFWVQESATLAYTTHCRLRPFFSLLSRAQRRLQVEIPSCGAKSTDGHDRLQAGAAQQRLVPDPRSAARSTSLRRDHRGHPRWARSRPAARRIVRIVIVLGTGFNTKQFVAPMEIVGRDGVSLPEAWSGRPRRTSERRCPASPTCSCSNGPNTNVGAGSVVNVLEALHPGRPGVEALRDRGAPQSSDSGGERGVRRRVPAR